MSQEVVCHVKMYFLYLLIIMNILSVNQRRFQRADEPERVLNRISGATFQTFLVRFDCRVTFLRPGDRLKETLSSRFVIFLVWFSVLFCRLCVTSCLCLLFRPCSCSVFVGSSVFLVCFRHPSLRCCAFNFRIWTSDISKAGSDPRQFWF